MPEYILLIGGVECTRGYGNSITKFTYAEDKLWLNYPIDWKIIGTLLFPRRGHRSMISDGRVFIIGGMNDEYGAYM